MFKPTGIMPALVTPFTEDRKKVDEAQLRALVNYCVKQGVHGVVPCGTTGEFVNMSVEEKITFIFIFSPFPTEFSNVVKKSAGIQSPHSISRCMQSS